MQVTCKERTALTLAADTTYTLLKTVRCPNARAALADALATTYEKLEELEREPCV